MQATVLINGLNINQSKKEYHDYDIKYIVTHSRNIIHEIAIITIALTQAVGGNALYDFLKIIIIDIFNRIKPRKDENSTKIKFQIDGKIEFIDFNFGLTDEQKNKLVDVIIEKLKK